MSAIKISSKVDETVWMDLQELARDSHQQISGLLTQAVREFVARRRVRPVVLQHLEASINANEELGQLLAK